MEWIFIVLLLIVVHRAIEKWSEGKDKPIEFDTPELKARREKFKKGVKSVLKEAKDSLKDPIGLPWCIPHDSILPSRPPLRYSFTLFRSPLGLSESTDSTMLRGNPLTP